MNSFRIITTYSPWLILVCLLVGGLYAWLLYTRNSPWSKHVNYGLAFLRFLVVSMLSFLLLGPLVRYISNDTLKPTIVFAIDNSQSVSLFSDTAQLQQAQDNLQNILLKLQDKGYNTAIRTLSELQPPKDLGQVKFREEKTNLSQLLSQVNNDFEQENLTGVVLLSDGIVNQGSSPTYANYNYTIFPVAVGDTVPKKDIILSSLRYNKVSYSGNRFPLEVELEHQGFGGVNATVLLKENGKTIDRRTTVLPQNRTVVQVPFQVMANGVGKRHYEVEVVPQQGEFTTLNNSKHAYIDIVKGKIKILVAAAAPHPDIKALRAAIESNENYETTLFIPGLNSLKQQDYDIAVLHQLPGRTPGGEAALNLVRQKNLPALYILGPQSDINAFNNLRAGVRVNSNGQTDEVIGSVNASFKTFTIATEAAERLRQYPPASVPYGNYQLTPNTEVILYQQVGRVRTDKPLLTVQTTGDKRTATLLAAGTWQWRLTEAANQEDALVYDKLITNLIQLLSAPRNKKRLNVYPTQTEYTSSDEIRFITETYNEALEQVYGQSITLRIKGENDSVRTFNFSNSENQEGVNVGSLAGGRYTYTATANINGALQQDKGEFIVEEMKLEALNAVADHNLLYQLASNTGSRLYYPTQLQQLEEDLLQADFKELITSQEELNDLVDLKWLFFVLLFLISTEWFVRKYNGSY